MQGIGKSDIKYCSHKCLQISPKKKGKYLLNQRKDLRVPLLSFLRKWIIQVTKLLYLGFYLSDEIIISFVPVHICILFWKKYIIYHNQYSYILCSYIYHVIISINIFLRLEFQIFSRIDQIYLNRENNEIPFIIILFLPYKGRIRTIILAYFPLFPNIFWFSP